MGTPFTLFFFIFAFPLSHLSGQNSDHNLQDHEKVIPLTLFQGGEKNEKQKKEINELFNHPVTLRGFLLRVDQSWVLSASPQRSCCQTPKDKQSWVLLNKGWEMPKEKENRLIELQGMLSFVNERYQFCPKEGVASDQ